MQRKADNPLGLGDWGLGPRDAGSYQDIRLGTMRHVLASVALEPGRKKQSAGEQQGPVDAVV